jgi:hypothetical protein
MAPPADIAEALAGLTAGPPALGAIVYAAAAAGWDYRDPERGGWTPREIVAHLADLEFNLHWTARVARILFEQEPELCAPEPDWRALEHRHCFQDPRVATGAYTLARKHLVAELTRQPPAAWDRVGVHPHTGRRTLLEIVQGFARHDRKHMARVRELLEMARGGFR